MLEIYFRVIIYHDNGEVVIEDYTGSDAEDLLHHVCPFFDGNHRFGEFCVGRTIYEAISDMKDSLTVGIEKAQEELSRCYELREKLEDAELKYA